MMTRPTVVSSYCFLNSIGSVCMMFWLSKALLRSITLPV